MWRNIDAKRLFFIPKRVHRWKSYGIVFLDGRFIQRKGFRLRPATLVRIQQRQICVLYRAERLNRTCRYLALKIKISGVSHRGNSLCTAQPVLRIWSAFKVNCSINNLESHLLDSRTFAEIKVLFKHFVISVINKLKEV